MRIEEAAGRLRKQFWTKEFFLFVVVGVVNTLDCSLFAAGLMAGGISDANIAFNIGYLISNILAYLLNCWLIFSTRPQFGQYLRFAISYAGNMAIENAAVLIFYNWLGFPPVISFVVAALVSVPVTFLLVKMYAFRQKQSIERNDEEK